MTKTRDLCEFSTLDACGVDQSKFASLLAFTHSFRKQSNENGYQMQ